LTTLLHLLADGGAVPAMQIDDGPRFSWRGLLIDVARHFIPVSALTRTLDAMALFKLNVLHLHLTDDQGFRFPSRAFPRLAQAPAYTKEELGLLVTYAGQRGIRVLPELDVPGHTCSWLQAYPEWGSGNPQPTRRFGVHRECLDPSNPTIFPVIQTLLGELAEVFPDEFVHIGGDEVHPEWWTASEQVRQYMGDHGLADVGELHAEFNRRVTAMALDLGKRVIGWDEVLHPRLPAPVVVQSWRGATARDRALDTGHDCVVSANYYLDLCFPADMHYRFDPEAPEAELVRLEDTLGEDPRLAHVAEGMAWTRHWRDAGVARESTEAETPRGSVIGAEACLWSELVDAETLDVRVWTRLPALAERFWSPPAQQDENDLYRRLKVSLELLKISADMDLFAISRRLLRRAGLQAAWDPLAAVLEPVKWYGRLLGEVALAARIAGREMPQSRPYDADTPLDRVVDGLFPESLEAREVARLCERSAAADPAAAPRLRAQAEIWRGLPCSGAGPAELDELARRLQSLGALMIDVMDGRMAPESAVPAALAAGRPHGEYLLAVADPVGRWLASRKSPAGRGSQV
jgi:hexosaminidase